MGAPCFGVVFCFKNHYPRSREHFLIPLSTPRQSPLRWIVGKTPALSGVFPSPSPVHTHRLSSLISFQPGPSSPLLMRRLLLLPDRRTGGTKQPLPA